MRQKALSILLAVFLVVAMLPLGASAADGDLFDQWVQDGIAQREGNNITLLDDFFIDAGMIAAVDADETLTVASGATLQVGGTLRVFGELHIQGTLYITAPKSANPEGVREYNLGLSVLKSGKLVIEDNGFVWLNFLSTHYFVGDPLGINMPENTGMKGDIIIHEGGWFEYGSFIIGPVSGMLDTRNPAISFDKDHVPHLDYPNIEMYPNASITLNFKNARTENGLGYVRLVVDQGQAAIRNTEKFVTSIYVADGIDLETSRIPVKMFVRTGAVLYENSYLDNEYENVEHLPTLPENPSKYFDDVAADAWYCDAAEYVYEHEIMSGTSDGIFEPNAKLNRAQAVQILYNLEGQPVATGSAGYSDTTDHWAINAINWASKNGIVSGVGNNRFDPNSPVSREQFAVMMYNYAQYKGDDLSAQADLTTFPDNGKVSSWALRALQWANGEGLINGSNGSLLPGGTATRGQAASILRNFDLNVVEN